MKIDENIRYSKILNQPHIHIYANEEELKSLSKRHYTCLADCYKDFKEYPEILKKIEQAFIFGIYYVKVKKICNKKRIENLIKDALNPIDEHLRYTLNKRIQNESDEEYRKK